MPLTTRFLAALVAALLSAAPLAVAQTAPEQKNQEQRPAPGDAAREDKRRMDEFAEAARHLGGPAAHPECVWLGRRVVNLLWRDDLDTAFRHLDLYDRFGCPGGHIQSTFRCLVRQGSIDPKAPDSLNARVHGCWINPNIQTTAPAAAGGPGASGSPQSGTAPPAGQPQAQ